MYPSSIFITWPTKDLPLSQSPTSNPDRWPVSYTANNQTRVFGFHHCRSVRDSLPPHSIVPLPPEHEDQGGAHGSHLTRPKRRTASFVDPVDYSNPLCIQRIKHWGFVKATFVKDQEILF
ncbi:hypothetical protein CEXT_210381 [Caerostris extrusa]|uniref:Uncharacterized protein n=1 Tax=Caerostris extrusa TaxID=172846 RepID=A0AAV4SM23_CAEEX|nr:hypothetical protein CEXT_210381 [Caerostris extrusa]